MNTKKVSTMIIRKNVINPAIKIEIAEFPLIENIAALMV